MTDRETFRLAPPVTFWWVWVAFVALNVADYAVQGLPSAHFGAVLAAVLLLATGLAFTLALRPRVTADDDGITVVNPYRTHVVPWRLVTLVDTGEWVQVHYARGSGAAPGAAPVSAGSGKVACWGLYVSTRARRKIASGPPRPRDPLSRGSLASSRLPDEAKYLASLPPAKAMALRLDSRADRERARPDISRQPPQATASWSWPALAAVVIPAIILLAVALA